jgi:hypothetical protein
MHPAILARAYVGASRSLRADVATLLRLSSCGIHDREPRCLPIADTDRVRTEQAIDLAIWRPAGAASHGQEIVAIGVEPNHFPARARPTGDNCHIDAGHRLVFASFRNRLDNGSLRHTRRGGLALVRPHRRCRRLRSRRGFGLGRYRPPDLDALRPHCRRRLRSRYGFGLGQNRPRDVGALRSHRRRRRRRSRYGFGLGQHRRPICGPGSHIDRRSGGLRGQPRPIMNQ